MRVIKAAIPRGDVHGAPWTRRVAMRNGRAADADQRILLLRRISLYSFELTLCHDTATWKLHVCLYAPFPLSTSSESARIKLAIETFRLEIYLSSRCRNE